MDKYYELNRKLINVILVNASTVPDLYDENEKKEINLAYCIKIAKEIVIDRIKEL